MGFLCVHMCMGECVCICMCKIYNTCDNVHALFNCMGNCDVSLVLTPHKCSNFIINDHV